MKFTQPRKIVLTGGPGVGKTSVLNYLRELKYSVREEVFTSLFKKAQDEHRFNDAFLNSKELIHDLIVDQMKLESQPAEGEYLFLDRSRIDIWGYAKNMGILPNVQDEKTLESAKYDFIFILDPLPSHYYDQNAIRRQTFEESLEHHDSVASRYQEFLKLTGQDNEIPIERVPFVEKGSPSSVKERTNFILKKLSEKFDQQL